MRTVSRTLRRTALVGVAAILLAACGDGDDDSTPTTSDGPRTALEAGCDRLPLVHSLWEGFEDVVAGAADRQAVAQAQWDASLADIEAAFPDAPKALRDALRSVKFTVDEPPDEEATSTTAEASEPPSTADVDAALDDLTELAQDTCPEG